MGIFNIFRKKPSTPTLRDGTPKQFDYFGFKVHGVASIDGVQELLAKIGANRFEEPNFIDLKVQDYNGEPSLRVYCHKKEIGSGDKQALNKFLTNCKGKRWIIHSFSVYCGDKDKIYGCRVKVKYFY